MSGVSCLFPVHITKSAYAQEFPPALLSSSARATDDRGVALPASVVSFLHEYIGQRRVTVNKAAPAFRRYDGEF